MGPVIFAVETLENTGEQDKLLFKLFVNRKHDKTHIEQRRILFVECREMASHICFCMRREIPNAAVGNKGGEGGKESRIREGRENQRGMGCCCKAPLTVEPPERCIQPREPVTHPTTVL